MAWLQRASAHRRSGPGSRARRSLTVPGYQDPRYRPCRAIAISRKQSGGKPPGDGAAPDPADCRTTHFDRNIGGANSPGSRKAVNLRQSVDPSRRYGVAANGVGHSTARSVTDPSTREGENWRTSLARACRISLKSRFWADCISFSLENSHRRSFSRSNSPWSPTSSSQ